MGSIRAFKSLAAVTLLIPGLSFLSSCGGGNPDDPQYPVPFSVDSTFITVWDGSSFNPFFIKGMNLGATVPGTQPGELAISRDQYRRWIARMQEMGVNSIRIYTLHFPEFYEELDAFNSAHRDKPIYLFQGIWLDEDNPTLDLYDMTAGFDAGITEVVDSIHGNKRIDFRHGRAYGDYTTDVAQWIMGFIIGREIYQDEVLTTDDKHKDQQSYTGKAISLPAGSPTEVWAAARLDNVVTYERKNYGQERPVSLSSWPTLDPLTHPTEGTYRREDIVQIDLANLDLSNAPAGYFATYHAYPYYPDFMSEQPDYLTYSDAYGPDSYLGYLFDLKRHYSKFPLIIGEFGVPSSWGNAHYAASGMNHGGLDEETQGRYDARMLYNIHDSGCGGGMLFEWADEWWKRTWIVDPLAYPRDRYKLWHNITSPEQNFGLLAFQLSDPGYTSFPGFTAGGKVKGLQAAQDCEYFYIRLTMDAPISSSDTLTVGFDTYRQDLGESILPCGLSTSNRAELALTVSGDGTAQLYVAQAYDLFGIWHGVSEDYQLYHSIPTDGAPWDPVRWMNNDAHHSDDWKYVFPATVQDIGKLRVRAQGNPATSLDAVELNGTDVDIRLPWTLLQFSDPTTASVISDDRTTAIWGSAPSDGIAVSICMGGQVLETGRFTWGGWDVVPGTTEREKPSLELFSQGMKGLPDYVK